MSDRKKIWERPKLIILERGRPEELVLAGCKMLGSKIKQNNRQNGCADRGNCSLACVDFSTS